MIDTNKSKLPTSVVLPSGVGFLNGLSSQLVAVWMPLLLAPSQWSEPDTWPPTSQVVRPTKYG